MSKEKGGAAGAAATAAVAGGVSGGPVGFLIGAGVGLLILGGAALIERVSSNSSHDTDIKEYRANIQNLDGDITKIQIAISALKGQSVRQEDQIKRYKDMCKRLRSEYDLSKKEYTALKLSVVVLEREVKKVEADLQQQNNAGRGFGR